jgi:predicted nucleotidyltransferase
MLDDIVITSEMETVEAIAERKQVLENELARYLRLLTENETPDKIIIFGSLATGNIHSWSDIDLIIIKPTDLPFLQRLRRIRKLLQPEVATDILFYTPEEMEELCRKRPFFREEILNKGIVVYERKE